MSPGSGGVRPSDAAPVLSFHAGSGGPFVGYALGLIEHVCGVAIDPVESERVAGGVDLYYGEDGAVPCRGRIPCVDRYGIRTVPGVPADWSDEPGAAFAFDVFAAMRFWLADEGNADAPAAAFDRHGRLLAEPSAQDAAGVREIPIVNAYLLALRDWIERRLGIRARRRLPAGKRCVIVLSHDVDRPLDPADLRSVLDLTRKRWRAGPLRASIAGAATTGLAGRAVLRSPGTRRWLFDAVASEEARRGFQSTFFFASTSRFDPGASWCDVAYDVDSVRMRQEFGRLLGRGSRIGLHIGYRAYEAAPQSIAAERDRLERAVGAPITGARHHYWHMGWPFWPTLDAHGAAGLAYDSSIAFNDMPGYRLGVALALRLWNPQTERAVSAVQVPTMAMDGHFFYRRNRTFDGVLAHLERLVNTLKRYEGVAAIDWHQEMSYPTRGRDHPWGQAYLEVLDRLAADPEVAVMPYDDVVAQAPARSSADDDSAAQS